jgi:dUTP pyrophosphatase
MLNTISIKIKKLEEDAIIPAYASSGAAGLDLVAIDYKYDYDYGYHEYGTGLAIEIPEGYVGLIFPRSSISKMSLNLANCVGVIDSDYRGEITFRFRESGISGRFYTVGDRIGQLIIVPIPRVTFTEVQKLNNTERGANGYGSTGV